MTMILIIPLVCTLLGSNPPARFERIPTTVGKTLVQAPRKKRDNPFNGAGLGAVVGFLFGVIVGSGACDGDSDCETMALLTTTAYGAGIGFAIDLAHSDRNPTYKAPGRSVHVPALRIRF